MFQLECYLAKLLAHLGLITGSATREVCAGDRGLLYSNPSNLSFVRFSARDTLSLATFQSNALDKDDPEFSVDVCHLIRLYFVRSSKHEQATREIMRLYDESKAISARSRINGHDSGISSAPSSATESVSSTDTMHGGSDEDLMTFKQNTVQRRPTPDANTLKGEVGELRSLQRLKRNLSSPYFGFPLDTVTFVPITFIARTPATPIPPEEITKRAE